MKNTIITSIISVSLLSLLACTSSVHHADLEAISKRQAIYDRYSVSATEINKKNAFGLSALSQAVRKQDSEAVNEFLANQRLNIYAEDRSLLIAIRDKNLSIVKSLLKAGIRVNSRNAAGDTPLILASRLGDSSIVSLLLNSGAHIDASNLKGRTALMEAANHGKLEVVKQLIASQANLNTTSNTQRTALMYAASKGYTETAVALVNAGAAVNTRDIKQRNPIFIAAAKGDVTLLKRLLQSGAKVDILKEDKKALEVAAKKGYSEVVQSLVQANKGLK